MDIVTDDLRTCLITIDGAEARARAIHEWGVVFDPDLADIVRGVANPHGGFHQQLIYALFGDRHEDGSSDGDEGAPSV